jgi:hypothetical protein
MRVCIVHSTSCQVLWTRVYCPQYLLSITLFRMWNLLVISVFVQDGSWTKTSTIFTLMWRHVQHNKLLCKKPTRCTNFTNLFCHETLHVLDSSSVHHQQFIHYKLSNGICHTGLWTAVEQDQDETAVQSRSCSKAVYKPVWHTPLLSVQWINCWWWTDELSERCRDSWQNKFVQLVHLVGFIVKKCVTMRVTSHECKAVF